MDDATETLLSEVNRETDFFKRAALLKTLKEDKKVTTKELARRLAMKASYVCHILRLNKLPDMVIDGYYSKLISISHLFIIARLKDHEQMIEAYEKVLSSSLTSAATDGLIREMLYNIKPEGKHLSKESLQELKDKIIDEKTNIDIKIIQTRIKAKIIIETWGNLEETSSVIRTITSKIRSGQPQHS